jgi:metallophosphoesterase (TIGR00282 family)
VVGCSRPGRSAPREESPLKILFVGEIVGSSGVFVIKSILPKLKEELGVELVIADGEGATGGFGIGRSHAIYLHKLGVDVITTGECAYYKKDIVEHLAKARYMLRPCNYPWDNPGRGWLVAGPDGQKVAVISVLGQAGFGRVHLANPFHVLPGLLERVKRDTRRIIVDYHATTTAEKAALFYFLRGQVSAVIGTHQRIQTADERLLDGTAVITDVGRTGSFDSVGGFEPEIEIRKFLTQVPENSRASWRKLELQGVLVDIAEDGKAVYIERVRRECTEVPHDRASDSPAGEQQ